MYHIVYLTTNLVNNKIYVGVHSTWNLNDNYLGSGLSLKNAIRKYYKNNFTRIILYVCLTKDDAYEIEKQIVSLNFISNPNTYNQRLGGKGSKVGNKNFNHSKETRLKMSLNHPKQMSPFHKQAHLEGVRKRDQSGDKNPFKGKHHTKECLEKRSLKVTKLYKITSTKEEIVVRGWKALINYFKQNGTSQYLVSQGKTDFRYEILE